MDNIRSFALYDIFPCETQKAVKLEICTECFRVAREKPITQLTCQTQIKMFRYVLFDLHSNLLVMLFISLLLISICTYLPDIWS